MSIVSVMPLYFGLRYTKSMEIDLRRQLVISLSIIVGSAIVAFIALYYMMGNISATADTIVKDKALGDQQTGALATCRCKVDPEDLIEQVVRYPVLPRKIKTRGFPGPFIHRRILIPQIDIGRQRLERRHIRFGPKTSP